MLNLLQTSVNPLAATKIWPTHPPSSSVSPPFSCAPFMSSTGKDPLSASAPPSPNSSPTPDQITTAAVYHTSHLLAHAVHQPLGAACQRDDDRQWHDSNRPIACDKHWEVRDGAVRTAAAGKIAAPISINTEIVISPTKLRKLMKRLKWRRKKRAKQANRGVALGHVGEPLVRPELV